MDAVAPSAWLRTVRVHCLQPGGMDLDQPGRKDDHGDVTAVAEFERATR
jgi:hypothetical protein